MILNRQLIVVSAAVVSLAACNNPNEPQPLPISGLPRPLSTAEGKLVSAGNTFSFALFERISGAQPGDNVFISPLSASLALGMTMNGAAGETFSEMRSALGLGGASESEMNEGYRDLKALLLGLDPSTQLGIANSIWYLNTFPFEQSFFTTAQTYFDAEVTGLDFWSPTALPTINDWVANATNDRIKKVLDRIEQDSRMFLINALYFKGVWQHQFNPADTRQQPFTSLDGTVAQVPLMHQDGEFRYLLTPEMQMVELPYGNSAFTMTILLPAPDRSINDFVGSLTPAQFDSWLDALRETRLSVDLPRFTLSYGRELNEELKALGMERAFVPDGADFTRMSPLGQSLYIRFVKQDTFVAVDEVGTEAAAVTTVGISVSSAPPAIRIDRPFVFAIRERFSGTILFIGKIVRLPA